MAVTSSIETMCTTDIRISGITNPFRLHDRGSNTGEFSSDECARVYRLHRSIPGYTATPLQSLQGLAGRLGVARIWVKDESCRFGLNAFKALGASYAISSQLLGQADELIFADVQARASNSQSLKPTFVTATDGNHGRAVAWIAQLLGANSVVYMPYGSQQVRVEAIRAYGGQVEVLEGSYDDAVNHAAVQAATSGWTVIQDTAWDDYTSVPLSIMQGYTTLLTEVFEQIGGETPTHLFLQAGVGSMAAAIQAVLIERYGMQGPRVIIVEPEGADCYFKSILAADGELHGIKGHLDTSMAGLACGTPSSLAWPIIRDYSSFFFKCRDDVTEAGMRLLASPVDADERVISGESGAVTTGLLAQLMEKKANRALARAISLGPDSKILLISTEGDTDPDNYRRVTMPDSTPG